MTAERALRLAAGALAAAFASFALGWFAPIVPARHVSARVSPETPTFVHPGGVIAEAARRLDGVQSELRLHEENEVDTSVEVASPPPAAPFDVVQAFRRELAAVVVEEGRAVALMQGDGGASLRLAAGSAYREGWRIRSIAPDAVVLEKRRAIQVVAVMGAPLSDVPAYVAGDPVPAPGARLLLTRQDVRARRP